MRRDWWTSRQRRRGITFRGGGNKKRYKTKKDVKRQGEVARGERKNMSRAGERPPSSERKTQERIVETNGNHPSIKSEIGRSD